jgi:flavin reductase (DIM6/NTAB) family NADH-FMN oxidoreductase RutF
MVKKVEIPLEVCTRLINHSPVALISTAYQTARDVMPLAWLMPASHTPRLVAISLVPKRYTYELLEKSKEFVINIPSINQKELVQKCGSVSGRNEDKFKAFNIRTLSADVVQAPLLEDCVAHLECHYVSEAKAGDHNIIIAEVLKAWANEGVMRKEGVVDLKKAQMLHHLGGNYFCSSEKEV